MSNHIIFFTWLAVVFRFCKKNMALSLLAAILPPLFATGQQLPFDGEYHNWFDGQIKRHNSGLFNGIEYKELYRTINERHKFYKSSEFQLGKVVYDGQFYSDVPLKYDLDSDQLLFNVGYQYPYPTLLLFKEKVKLFSVGQSNFVLINYLNGPLEMNGFYEILLDKNAVTLLKKHKKKRFKRIRGNTVYYEFEEVYSFFIRYNEQYHQINTLKDVIEIWPDKRDDIKKNLGSAFKNKDLGNYLISFLNQFDSFPIAKE